MEIVHSHKLAKNQLKVAFLKKCNLRHFQISHNSPYSPRKKFCITFVFLLGWVLQPSLEKLKTALLQNFGGQIRCIMGNLEVAYSTKRDFLVYIRHLHISHNTPCFCTPPPQFFHNPCTFFPLGITVVPREIKDCLCKTRSIMEDVKIANYPFQLFHFSIVYEQGKFGKNL